MPGCKPLPAGRDIVVVMRRFLAILLVLTTGTAFAQNAAQDAPKIPEGYTAVPFLSETPEREFAEADEVLEPDQDYAAVLQTNKGTMVLDLLETQAPETVNNFVFLARHHFYDGVVFHRVLDGFMAQTGDPTGTGTGGPGYAFDDEIADGLSFDKAGILAMANAGPDTNGSQFFITFEAAPHLDGGYSIFGDLLAGEDVLPELERIDPSSSEPAYVFSPDDALAKVKRGGLTLPESAKGTLGDYLEGNLESMPEPGEEFQVAGYKGIVGQSSSGDTLVGFYAKPDVLESVTIVEKPKS